MTLIKILVALLTMVAYGIMLVYEPKTKIGWIAYTLATPALAIVLFGVILMVLGL